MTNKKSPTKEAVKHRKDNDSKPLTQEQIISIALAEKPKTRRQIEAETGVHNNTIDWIVSNLMKSDVVFIAYFGICPITSSEGVQFICSNNDYRPKGAYVQLEIF